MFDALTANPVSRRRSVHQVAMGGGRKGLSNPADTQAYCTAWLAQQCHRVPGACEALLVVRSAAGGSGVLNVGWPIADVVANASPLSRLAAAALADNRTVATEADAQDAGTGPMVAVPLGFGDTPDAAIALRLSANDRNARPLYAIADDLRWGAGWLQVLAWVDRCNASNADLAKSLTCLEVVAAAGEQARFAGAATAIVNAVALKLNCDRVSLGVERSGGGARLVAMSHASDFAPASRLAELIETAMEEALDQEPIAVVHPPPALRDRRVAIAQRALANEPETQRATVLSVALTDSAGAPVGALTLERHSGPTFEKDSIELMEAMAALLGPALAAHIRANRLVAGRIVEKSQDYLAILLGPRRPAAKLGALAVAGTLAGLALIPSDFRVTARAAIEPELQRAAVAPFEGFIASSTVRAGSLVRKGDVLATLDEHDLRLEHAKWAAERDKLLQKQRQALAKHDRAALRVIEAQLEQTISQLSLADEKLSRARVKAPFDGVVVSGDLSQMIGAPVERGKTLFEIAPLDAYRLVVQVDERDIDRISAGQSGTATLASLPTAPLLIEVSLVTPVAQVEEGRNSYRVEARLVTKDERLRPGMEGVVKLNAGRRSLMWIWTHSLVDWLRLAAWRYLP